MKNQSIKQDHYKVIPKQQEEEIQYLSGRGAQINTPNPFLKTHQNQDEIESIDDWEIANPKTQ
ncbi:MAG: radical SAM protein, partial [Ginsengibacter sp.]